MVFCSSLNDLYFSFSGDSNFSSFSLNITLKKIKTIDPYIKKPQKKLIYNISHLAIVNDNCQGNQVNIVYLHLINSVTDSII
jgi:hypothetical protein